jgi:hypothetical protein
MRYLIATIAFLSLFPPLVSAEEFDAEKYIADGAVMLFGAGCLKYYPNQSEFEAWVRRNKFDVIPSHYTSGLVQEAGGIAYSVNNNGVRYALVAEPGNLCTVFVKEVNLGKASEALTNLRHGLSTDSVIEDVSSKEKEHSMGVVRTTEYTYSKEGKWIMTLVVSESTSNQGFFQLAMSAKTQLRANNQVNKDSPR